MFGALATVFGLALLAFGFWLYAAVIFPVYADWRGMDWKVRHGLGKYRRFTSAGMKGLYFIDEDGGATRISD